MKTGAVKVKSNVAALEKALARLVNNTVLVGVPSEKTTRKPDKGKGRKRAKAPEPPAKAERLSNAEIAYIQDNGAPEANIPARPFMRPGIAAAKDRIAKRMKLGAQKTLKGDLNAPSRTMDEVGLIAQSAIQDRINDGPFAPLSPRTLAERLRRGRTGTRPLIDRGQMRNSINYVLRHRYRNG